MSADLDETLDELGPDYRNLVGRLRAADALPEVRAGRRPHGRLAAVLTAASLVACLVLGVLLGVEREPVIVERRNVVRTDGAAHEYRLALMRSDEAFGEILRTQEADGGWKTAFLTRQNAEALRLCPSAEARVAYKRAMRNLRARGCGQGRGAMQTMPRQTR